MTASKIWLPRRLMKEEGMERGKLRKGKKKKRFDAKEGGSKEREREVWGGREE